MKPEQQRIAIAESCGIVGPFDNRWIKEYEEEGGDSYGFTGFEKGELVFIPDYLNDLNAMHEAEKTLDYDDLNDMEESVSFHFGVTPFHSTAAQRAEAFLKTIGKWEEEA
jgi:hypothetical protein